MTGVALFAPPARPAGRRRRRWSLVPARLLQGFAGGLVTPQVSGFIQSLFRGEERGKAFGFLGTTVGALDGHRPPPRRRLDRPVRAATTAGARSSSSTSPSRCSRSSSPAATCRAPEPQERRRTELRPGRRAAARPRPSCASSSRSSSSAPGTARCASRCSRWRRSCSPRGCCTSAATGRTTSRSSTSASSGSAPTSSGRASGSSTSPGSRRRSSSSRSTCSSGCTTRRGRRGWRPCRSRSGGAITSSLGSRRVLRRGRKLIAGGLSP